jgi:PhnB protein
MTKLHSYLNFAGNAEEAFDFYKSVFGGEFSSLVRFEDLPIEGVTIPKEDEDKIMHIALPIGEDNPGRALAQHRPKPQTALDRLPPPGRG